MSKRDNRWRADESSGSTSKEDAAKLVRAASTDYGVSCQLPECFVENQNFHRASEYFYINIDDDKVVDKGMILMQCARVLMKITSIAALNLS